MSNDPYSTPTHYREADLKAWTAEIERARRCSEPDCEGQRQCRTCRRNRKRAA